MGRLDDNYVAPSQFKALTSSSRNFLFHTFSVNVFVTSSGCHFSRTILSYLTVFRYAAHKATVMEDAVKALVGGGISTPSVGSPVSSEGEGIPEQVPAQSPRSKELKSSSSQEDEEENSADYNSGTLETDGAEHSTTVTTTSAGTCSSSEEGNVCSKEAASTSDTSEVSFQILWFNRETSKQIANQSRCVNYVKVLECTDMR